MRFLRHIQEEIEHIHDKSPVIDILKKNCNQYIGVISKCNKPWLYRGTSHIIEDIIKIVPRTNRRPRDTAEYTQMQFDKKFYKKFGWKVRSEGVMVSSSRAMAESYAREGGGRAYEFYPTDGFKYVWSPYIEDFFVMVRNLYPGSASYNYSYNHNTLDMYKREMGAVLQTIKRDKDELETLSDTNAISEFVADAIVETYIDDKICQATSKETEIIFNCDAYYLAHQGSGI